MSAPRVVPKAHRVESGCYAAIGTRDADGFPYLISLEGRQGLPGAWVVRDARERVVSRHFTMRDALESLEVAE